MAPRDSIETRSPLRGLSGDFSKIGKEGYHQAAAQADTAKVSDMSNAFAANAGQARNALLFNMLSGLTDGASSSVNYVTSKAGEIMGRNATREEKDKRDAQQSYMYVLLSQMQQNLQRLIDGLNQDINTTNRVLGRMDNGTLDIDGNADDAVWFAKYCEETCMTREQWDAMSEGERHNAIVDYRDGKVEEVQTLETLTAELSGQEKMLAESGDPNTTVTFAMTDGVFDNPLLEEAVKEIEAGPNINGFNRAHINLNALELIEKTLTKANKEAVVTTRGTDENLPGSSAPTAKANSTLEGFS